MPEGECTYIRQSMSAYVITNTVLHFWYSKLCPNLKEDVQLVYIVTQMRAMIVGGYFNVSMMIPTVLVSIVELYSH